MIGRSLPGLLFMFAASVCAQPNVTAWQIVQDGLASPKVATRVQAVAAIGSVGLAPEAIKLVEEALHDKDPEVRQMAAIQLGAMKSKQSIPALQAALDDPSVSVAFSAAQALWEFGDRGSRATIQSILTGERKGPGFVQGSVLDAKKTMRDPKKLALIGVKEASGALLGPFSLGIVAAEGLLKDSGAAGRTLATTMLAEDTDPYSLELLEWTLDTDKNWVVKAAAARAIGKAGNQQSIPKLERYLGDEHDALRFMAAAAIVRLSLSKTSADQK